MVTCSSILLLGTLCVLDWSEFVYKLQISYMDIFVNMRELALVEVFLKIIIR